MALFSPPISRCNSAVAKCVGIKELIKSWVIGRGVGAKLMKGGAWLGCGNIAEQVLRFARNLILVRLLVPAAFGTMAIVLSANAVLQAFTEIGLREALIQNPRGGEREFVDAAWALTLGRALLTYAAIFVAAPWVAAFYGNLELTPLLRVAVASLILEGAMSTRAYVALKEMKFSKWAVIFHGGGIIGAMVTVVIATLLRNAWALVIGVCVESGVRCVLSYIVCPYLPSLRLHGHAVRELLKFSRGLFGLSLLNLIFLRTDTFVLAKLITPAALGYYTMSVYLVQIPTSFVMNLMGQLLMPTLSEIQKDRPRTNYLILRLTMLLVLLGMPIVVFAYFCGRSLLALVYGQAYAAGAGPFILAACVALITVVNSLITGVFYAAGLPQLHRRCVAATAVTMIVLAYPLAKWLGPVGGQLACVISVSIGFALQAERIHHVTGFDISRYGKIFASGLAASAVVAVLCLTARSVAILARSWPSILVGVVGCFLAYSLAGLILFCGSRLPKSLFSAEHHDLGNNIDKSAVLNSIE